jgi:peptidoglycan/xylan/chitin deacetylase (PgdA/CDA1 family)
MLRELKLRILSSADKIGLTARVRNSAWRTKRLLILCYHGIAQHDENIWNPGLYLHASAFEKRMERLRRARCNVLPLTEALQRLRRGDLPERSVAITFDDGWHDFYKLAFPILRRFEIPATVYLTTYYVDFNRPVFDTMLQYLLWKAAGRHLRLDSVVPEPVALDRQGTPAALDAVLKHVQRNRLDGRAKDDLLTTLAHHLEVDYDTILRERVLHLMNRSEIQDIADAGIGVQLHTHRHRVAYDHERFSREVRENREVIRSITGVDPIHFCYPGGNSLPEFGAWLSEAGVVSATTCESSMCRAGDNLYFLPRLLDLASTSDVEFDAWVSGIAAFLPRRRLTPAPGQFLED